MAGGAVVQWVGEKGQQGCGHQDSDLASLFNHLGVCTDKTPTTGEVGTPGGGGNSVCMWVYTHPCPGIPAQSTGTGPHSTSKLTSIVAPLRALAWAYNTDPMQWAHSLQEWAGAHGGQGHLQQVWDNRALPPVPGQGPLPPFLPVFPPHPSEPISAVLSSRTAPPTALWDYYCSLAGRPWESLLISSIKNKKTLGGCVPHGTTVLEAVADGQRALNLMAVSQWPPASASSRTCRAPVPRPGALTLPWWPE